MDGLWPDRPKALRDRTPDPVGTSAGPSDTPAPPYSSFSNAQSAKTGGLPWSIDIGAMRHPLRLLQSRTRFLPLQRMDGTRGGLYEDTPRGRAMVERLQRQYPQQADRLKLAKRAQLNRIVTGTLGDHLTQHAQTHLLRAQPEMSAHSTLWPRQAAAIAVIGVAACLWGLAQPAALLVVLNALFAFFYLSVGLARLIAIFTPLPRNMKETHGLRRMDDEDLPTYSVLVPIYDEADMVPQLVGSLTALDYPQDKLDILVLCEADDRSTLEALEALNLNPSFSVVAVPPSEPRTKPKALNFGLALARGDFVTIYDAEDRPEPGQLRCAVNAFQHDGKSKNRGTKGLACVQAALNVTNTSSSFFTRHFALEYMALFDAFLPALSRFGLPIPLGGTSNHFRRHALIEAGAWDPFNVTEDADLGIRLARLGYRTQVIDSTTYEVAPVRFKPWVKQRARWFKGWWQTWLVHMRRPLKLMGELGLPGFLAFQTIFLGVLVSVLIHPFFLIPSLWAISGLGVSLALDSGSSTQALALMNSANFLLGYLAAAALSGVGAKRRGAQGILPVLLTIPLYWMCLSVAGFLALWELIRRPHHWNKTPHGET